MKLEITIPVLHIHVHSPGHAEIMTGIRRIINQGEAMSEASKELLDVVNAIPPAVDAFEARITEILSRPAIDTPETKADIAAAVATLRGALADAADGVDEAATPATP